MMLLSTLRAAALVTVSSCLVARLGLVAAVSDNGKSSADYFIHSLPGQPPGPLLKMHAGHITVDQENNGNLFFWHVNNNHIDAKQRTVIWINGGPGCSSMDGALMEIGPYRVREGSKLELNPGSWNEFANLLFVDNPVGTGFSYTNTNAYLHELSEMAAHFITFLERFFELFPEYELDEIFISGESYAGQHIPYIAQAILARNAQTTGVKWNVAGLLIGNGWIDPTAQYPAYLAYAYKAGMVTRDSDIANRLETQQKVCLAKMAQGNHHIDIGDCEQILQNILRETLVIKDGKNQCYNMYDVRLKDSYPSCGMSWPPDLETVTPYLKRPDVVAALHINPDKKTGWQECSGSVSTTFRARNSKPSIELLPMLLEHMPILLFSGEQDFICNHIGTENLINNMTWGGRTGFETELGVWAPRTVWEFEGAAVGYYQNARNLTYVLIHNSSHMVPFDLPRQTRDMLDRFVGVDIGTIGGPPSKAKIGDQDSPITSVGGTPNSTQGMVEEEKKVDAARWQAYYRSGEVALVFVAFAAVLWGIFVWRQRTQHKHRGGEGGTAYQGLNGRSSKRGDLEEGDFDESELDELHVASPGMNHEDDRYSIGGDSDEEEEEMRETKGKQRQTSKEN